jgi:hypothetical protein
VIRAETRSNSAKPLRHDRKAARCVAFFYVAEDAWSMAFGGPRQEFSHSNQSFVVAVLFYRV